MKKILFICFLIFACLVSQAQNTYYVSASGNDSAAGTADTTSWKTLTKLNGTAFSSGDKILFKRGDTFRGTLRITASGITIGAYGSGNKPILSGAEPLTTTWSVASGSVYQTTLSSPPTEITNLFRSDTALNISRYPNKNVNNGYLNFESTAGKTQFTDNQLSGDWSNAEIVVRGERYRLARTKVSSQSGTTINIVSSPYIINDLTPGRGYFLRNDLRAIDSNGEWAYDVTTGKVYLQSSTPPSSIEFAKHDSVLIVKNASNVTVSNLQIERSNRINIYAEGGANLNIDSCDIRYSGGDAVYFSGVSGVQFQDNTLTGTNWNGVTTSITCSSVTIQRNTINNIGNEAFGKNLVFYGIYNMAPGAEILNNHVSYTVGIGILACGINTYVKHNLVEHALTGLEDYGAIYTNFNVGNNTGLVIEENIIRNISGEQAGAPTNESLAMGIYVDNASTKVTLKNNTVYNVAGSCYFTGTFKADIVLQNNTAFNGGEHEFQILNPNNFPVTAQGNIFISKKTDSTHIGIRNRSPRATLPQGGFFRDNYVMNPFTEKTIVVDHLRGSVPITEAFTPYKWNLATASVNGTSPAPFNYPSSINPDSVVLFYANPTASNALVTLPPGNYMDAKGQGYTGSTSIAPFKSLGLLKYNGPVAAFCAIPTGTQTTNVRDFSAIAKWNAVTDVVNYDLRFRVTDSTDWVYAYNVHDTTVTMSNLIIGGNYEWQVRSSCFTSETSWSASQLFQTITLPPVDVSLKELLGASAIVSWNPYREAVFYQVRYKTTASGTWITPDSTTTTELFISELSPSTAYVASVRSQSVVGWSDWSDTLSFTTKAGGQVVKVKGSSPNHWLTRNVTNNTIAFRTNATSLFIGRVTNTETGIAVFPIQLPALASGQQVTGADFLERMDSPVGPVMPQLWALPYRNTANYDLGDYYDGVFSGANQPLATLIQDPWIDVNAIEPNRAYNINLLNSGRNALLNYFQSQYTNGAGDTDFAFLRINPTAPTTASRLLIDRTEDSDAYAPTVTFILSPLSGTLPAAASQATATVTGTASINLSWQDNSSNEIGFIVERRKAGEHFMAIDTVAVNTTSFSDSGLSADTRYDYRILAYNASGAIGYSRETIAKTSLAAPTGLAGVIKAADGAIALTWQDTNTTESGFIIQRKSGSANFSTIGTVGSNVYTFSDTTSQAINLPYTYRVRAYTVADTSAYSATYTVTENDFEIITVYQALSSVNGTSTTPATYTNTTAANAVLDLAPTFYSTTSTGGCFYAVQANFTQAANTYSSGLASYAEFRLKPANGSYKLKISSINIKLRKAIGETYNGKFRITYSNDGGATFVDNGTDLIPSAVACSAAGYGIDFVNISTQAWDMNDFEVTNSSTGVRIRIYYYNQPTAASMGIPFISVQGSVIPVLDTLDAPTNLNAVIKSGTQAVDLIWDDLNDNETGFYLERKSGTGSYVVIDTLVANTVFYKDNATSVSGLPYTYRLRAFSAADTSTYSLPLTVTEANYEVLSLYQALSSANGTVSTPATYSNTLASKTNLSSVPTFYPTNPSGGCYYAVQANFSQSATTYSSGLSTYMEFKLKPSAGHKLRISSIETKARQAVGASYTTKYRIAYSLDNGTTWTNNGTDLLPTGVSCSAAGFGSSFANLALQTWYPVNFEVTDSVRIRVSYFNQSAPSSLGLPLVVVKGTVIPTPENHIILGLAEQQSNDEKKSKTQTLEKVASILLYPNPVVNGQYFQLRLSDADKATVKLLSINGNAIPINTSVTNKNELTVRVKTQLPSGIYLVQVTLAKGKKVILKAIFP